MSAVVLPQAPALAWRDWLALGKPRLSSLVLCTAATGMHLAPKSLAWPRALALLLAIAVVVAAANVLNCYLERDTDALMRRTRARPLAARRIDPRLALGVSLTLAGGSLAVLYRVGNPLTALLAFVAYASYGWVYTPMKRHSAWALVVGGLPGAIPPLLGFTAACNQLCAAGLSLFAILFAWQMPHFLAIALYLSDDYARGGLRVLPLMCSSRRVVALVVLASLLQLAASLWPYRLGIAGPGYACAATLLGVAFTALAVSGLWAQPIKRWGRQLFVASVAYLTVLLALLVARV